MSGSSVNPMPLFTGAAQLPASRTAAIAAARIASLMTMAELLFNDKAGFCGAGRFQPLRIVFVGCVQAAEHDRFNIRGRHEAIARRCEILLLTRLHQISGCDHDKLSLVILEIPAAEKRA